MRSIFWIVFIIVIVGTGYWLWSTAQQSGGEEDGSQIANPAAVYCIDQGGTLDMSEDEMGTQGFCVFPDGIACDEWAFFRGEACQDKVKSSPQQTASEETDASRDELLANPLESLPF